MRTCQGIESKAGIGILIADKVLVREKSIKHHRCEHFKMKEHYTRSTMKI